MVESCSDYHRRRAAEELAEAARHADDITADHHRALARQHLALARELEEAASKKPAKPEVPPPQKEAGPEARA
jgi:hypothetical protein